MNKNIIQQVRKIVDLSESEVEIFNKYVTTHQFKKKEFVNLADSVCKQLHFVE